MSLLLLMWVRGREGRGGEGKTPVGFLTKLLQVRVSQGARQQCLECCGVSWLLSRSTQPPSCKNWACRLQAPSNLPSIEGTAQVKKTLLHLHRQALSRFRGDRCNHRQVADGWCPASHLSTLSAASQGQRTWATGCQVALDIVPRWGGSIGQKRLSNLRSLCSKPCRRR